MNKQNNDPSACGTVEAGSPPKLAGDGNRSGASQRLPDRLLDIHEAATMLGLKPSTLYAWSYERRIPVVKLGRALRFKLSVIEKLIADSERPARRSG